MSETTDEMEAFLQTVLQPPGNPPYSEQDLAFQRTAVEAIRRRWEADKRERVAKDASIRTAEATERMAVLLEAIIARLDRLEALLPPVSPGAGSA